MNTIRSALAAAVWMAAVLLTGCATNRGTMSLAVPAASDAPEGDKVAVIENVVDNRVFEIDPRDPSTPSLKKGNAYELDSGERKQAIARKRNGFGLAMGDILLEGDQTVETIVGDMVRAGLQQRGYRIVDASGAGADALRLKVGIEKFWAWFTPGFWSVSMEAQVHTTIATNSAAGQRAAKVEAYGINKGQSGREGNWRVAYERAFEDYATKLQAALDAAGI